METSGRAISEVLGSRIPDNVNFEQLQVLIEHMVQQEAAKRKTSPNELIRIVRDGQVLWMTAEEADQLLNDADSESGDNMRASVERALKGETKVLHLELRSMVAVAIGMLDRYAEQKSVDINEIQRIRPSLIQLERRINSTVGKLREVETRINAQRRENPVFDEFEGKMGQLLNLQRSGKKEDATLLAKELVSLRKKYIMLSRGLASDTNAVYDHRLELQKNKKSILSNQRYMTAQRQGVLMEEVKDGRKKLDSLCGGRSLDDAIKSERGDEVQECSESLQAAEGELKAVSKGLKVIEMQQKEVESVITQIIQHVIQEEKPDAPQEKTGEPSPELQPEPAAVKEEKSTAPIHRMATAGRRR